MTPKIESVIDAGSPDRNEDYIWIGSEEGVNAVLILDGTSGTAGDFGAENGKTGGQRYVESIGESVREILESEPGKNLEQILKEAIENAWDLFEEQGEKESKRYLDGEDATYPRSETVPGAVGCLIRWDENNLEILHIGDVETFVEKESGLDFYSNATHERFDHMMNEAVRNDGKNSEKAEKLRDLHRSANSLPGTYPQIGFNPLAVEKQGEKESYDTVSVEKIVLSTDGGTTRMKKLLDMENKELLDFVSTKGVEKALEELREKERNTDVGELKQSDDAAIIEMRFNE